MGPSWDGSVDEGEAMVGRGRDREDGACAGYTANSVKRSSQIRRSAVAQMIPDAEPVAFPCSNCLNDRMEN